MKPVKPLLLVLVLLLFPGVGAAESGNVPNENEKTPVFREGDLKRYTGPEHDQSFEGVKRRSSTKKDSSATRDRETKERDRWCRQAAKLKRRIEQAGAEVKELKSSLREAEQAGEGSKKEVARLKKRLEKARHSLREEEEELGFLEEEAHRKGVPPGWLRCQAD